MSWCIARKVMCVRTTILAAPFIHVRKAPNFEGIEGYIVSGKNIGRLFTMYHTLWSNQSILPLQPTFAFWLQMHLIYGLWQFHNWEVYFGCLGAHVRTSCLACTLMVVVVHLWWSYNAIGKAFTNSCGSLNNPMQLTTFFSQAATSMSDMLAQIFYMGIDIEASRLMFFKHQVLCEREASRSSIALEGKKGMAGPLLAVSSDARSLSIWVVLMLSEKSSITALWARAMLSLSNSGYKPRLSPAAFARSVWSGKLDQSSCGLTLHNAFSTIRVFRSATSNSCSSFSSNCPSTWCTSYKRPNPFVVSLITAIMIAVQCDKSKVMSSKGACSPSSSTSYKADMSVFWIYLCISGAAMVVRVACTAEASAGNRSPYPRDTSSGNQADCFSWA